MKRALSIVLLASLTGVVGCGSNERQRDPARGELREAAAGRDAILLAKQRWDSVTVGGLMGNRLVAELEKIVEHLDSAIALDRAAPLPLTLKAYMMLELGRPEEAEKLFLKSVGPASRRAEGSQDWVPGYLGLARIAYDRGELAPFQEYLHHANGAADALAGKDPRIPKEVRERLVGWMTQLEAWSEDVAPGVSAYQGDVLARARAEAKMLELLSLKPELDCSAFDPVFAIDPDYFPARIRQASCFASAGEHAEVIRVLGTTLAASGNPKLLGNFNYLYMVAHAHAYLYNTTGGKEHLAASYDLLQRVLIGRLEHAPARLDFLLVRVKALEAKHLVYVVGNLPDTLALVEQGISEFKSRDVFGVWSKEPLPGFTPDADASSLRARLADIENRVRLLREVR